MMKNFNGKTAVVTGAASGIGKALSLAFAGRGANVVMADVEATSLELARSEVAATGAEVIGVPTDVTKEDQVGALADAAWENFGAVHGVRAFVPRMRDSGEEGHIVNTASEAGHFAGDGYGVYNTSKFAVVGLTESLARDLRNTKIGVSMLCPGQVETGIFTNTNRPAEFQREGAAADVDRRVAENVMEPADVAAKVVAGIEEGALYVFSHEDEGRMLIEKRHARLMRSVGG